MFEPNKQPKSPSSSYSSATHPATSGGSIDEMQLFTKVLPHKQIARGGDDSFLRYVLLSGNALLALVAICALAIIFVMVSLFRILLPIRTMRNNQETAVHFFPPIFG